MTNDTDDEKKSAGSNTPMDLSEATQFSNAQQQKLFDYWSSLRNDHLMPFATDIDPTRIVPLLKEITIFEIFGEKDVRYRLAGTGVAERLGADPTGKNLFDITAPETVGTVAYLFETLFKQPVGAIVQYENTYNTGRRAPVSSLFLPLAAVEGGRPRVLSIHTREASTDYEDAQNTSTIGTTVTGIHWIDIGAGIPTSN